MGKRANGEGTNVKRGDGLRMGQIRIIDPATGGRKRVTVYGRTKQEVANKLAQIRQDNQGGLPADAPKITMREFLELWLEGAAKSAVRPVTLVSYRRTLEAHAYPAIGAVKLGSLVPMHLQTLYDERIAAGKSRRTVQYLHAILHRALRHAVKTQILPRNPADQVDAPRPVRRETKPATTEQVLGILQAFAGHALEPLVNLAVYTGCRRGELLALRWSDVDLECGAVTINRTLEEISATEVKFSEPKTQKSRRQVPIHPDAVAALRRHKSRQAAERIAMNADERASFVDQDLVFCKRTGGPLQPQNVTWSFKYVLDKYGIMGFRLHDLRHAHATLMLQDGRHIKVVSERLGHSTIQITGDIYSHVLPTIQVEAANSFGEMLKPKPAAGSPEPGKKTARKLL